MKKGSRSPDRHFLKPKFYHVALTWKFWLKPLFATIFCLFTYTIIKSTIGYFFSSIETLNPYEAKVEDFELSDLCFANSHAAKLRDKNIYIIDITKDSLSQIARKLIYVNSCKPKAIGLDIIFKSDITKASDTLITTVNNIVRQNNKLVIGLEQNETGNSSTLSLPFYEKLKDQGDVVLNYHFGYLSMDEALKTKRLFNAFYPVKDRNSDTAFETEILKVASGDVEFKKYLKEQESWHIINYRNYAFGKNRYHFSDQLPGPSELSNKIVLFGSLDSNVRMDMYYTPLNGTIGRSLPDMAGVEYHAQILSMMLDHDFVYALPRQPLLIFFSCYFFMFFFMFLSSKYEKLYHYILDALLIVLILIFLPISLFALDAWHTKLEPMDFIVPIFSCGFLLNFYQWCCSGRIVKKYQTRLISIINGHKD